MFGSIIFFYSVIREKHWLPSNYNKQVLYRLLMPYILRKMLTAFLYLDALQHIENITFTLTLPLPWQKPYIQLYFW